MGQRDEKRVSYCLKAESGKNEKKDFRNKKVASHGTLLMVVKTSVHNVILSKSVAVKKIVFHRQFNVGFRAIIPPTPFNILLMGIFLKGSRNVSWDLFGEKRILWMMQNASFTFSHNLWENK